MTSDESESLMRMVAINRTRLLTLPVLFWAAYQTHFTSDGFADEPKLAVLRQAFRDYSGAELVFHRDDLPAGRYHDVLKPLHDSQKVTAATICIEEAKMYPPGFFGEVGLKAVGVFEACASKTTTDLSRPYDTQLGGYRYFGIYNGNDAVAAAFYNEGQLSLTFHHEIFHHVDSTVNGETGTWNLSTDDAFYFAAISGFKPYSAPPVAGDDLASLRERCIGLTLKDAVSQYAAKNSHEDQAETARHVMSMLPNSLVQAIDNPELPGSQRILHVLREYKQSTPDGPGFDWFVDVVLQRAHHERTPTSADELLAQLREYADIDDSDSATVATDPRGARAALRAAVRLKPESVTPRQSHELVQLATQVTGALLQQRIRPDSTQSRFDVWGQEGEDGVNRTLRRDVAQFGSDARRLKLIAANHQRISNADDGSADRAQLNNLRLIAHYYAFIKSNWSMTPGTASIFDSARLAILDSLIAGDPEQIQKLRSMDLADLALESPNGFPQSPPLATPQEGLSDID